MAATRTLVCDVGSGSVRVAILEYSSSGVLQSKPLAHSTKNITIFNPQTDFYEQNTTEIWQAFIDCCRECLASFQIDSVDAIAFSATCSLVILDPKPEVGRNDVIMWMDHRAKEQADRITGSGHPVLEQFGGKCSPEFSLSKLVWLSEKDGERFRKAEGFMELPDWLGYRCSSRFGNPRSFSRSLCSMVCKWGFEAEEHRWPEDLFEDLGEYFALSLFLLSLI